MKIRNGFVSNSSSSSFVIGKKFLSESDVDAIRDWLGSDENVPDCWTMREQDDDYRFYTIIDNGQFDEWLEQNVPNVIIHREDCDTD